jgi:hypothetical protein
MRNNGYKAEQKTYYVYTHRKVWEENAGRKLPRGFVVHHVNGNKLDNRYENLVALTPTYHNNLHKEARDSGCDLPDTASLRPVERRLLADADECGALIMENLAAMGVIDKRLLSIGLKTKEQVDVIRGKRSKKSERKARRKLRKKWVESQKKEALAKAKKRTKCREHLVKIGAINRTTSTRDARLLLMYTPPTLPDKMYPAVEEGRVVLKKRLNTDDKDT